MDGVRAGGLSALAQGDCAAPKANSALGLAHDFRNMLQLATSSFRIARRQMLERSQAALAATLSDGLEALERANCLAHRLTASGAGAVDLEPVHLQELVPKLRPMLSCALGTEISLASLMTEGLSPVFCDRLQLENAIVNLALNARHAMPHGGSLLIEALPCMHKDHGDCVALCVADSGCGMSQKTAEQAFQPFFSTRLGDGGSGLGLFNVRSFVENLGGNIELSTKENRGTRIILHLPAMRGGLD